jgi:hypothetical protein
LIFWSFFIKKKGHRNYSLWGPSKSRPPEDSLLGLDFLATFSSSRRSACFFGGEKVASTWQMLVEKDFKD